MNCPSCQSNELRTVFTKQGVEVDFCDFCKGIWLDKGEIFLFSKRPETISQKLEKSLKGQTPTSRLSPRSGEPMVEISYPGGPRINFCKKSGGLWFDHGELKSILAQEKDLRLEVDRETVPPHPSESMRLPGQLDQSDAERHAKLRAGLLPLPNLFFRSTLTLIVLYGLLVAILIAAVEFAGLELEVAVLIGIGVAVLQFVLGPFLMDLSLRWMYQFTWVAPADLPNHLQEFVTKICRDKEIKFPRFGIIEDGAPQAFTYGHTPNNARVVISRGILELLTPEEAEAVVAHELGHAIHWDMFLMTVVQLVPLILYYVYRTLIQIQRSNGEGKSGNYRVAVAIAAYIIFIISQYLVLWFSRTREYHADRFSGEVTGNPSKLASALVKIAYGLAGQEGETEGTEGSERRAPNLEAIGALGIFDTDAARGLAVTSYAEGTPATGEVDKGKLKGAMRWDLWNPWAKWYELNSTHPLVANRLRYLSDQAVQMGQQPYVVFDEERPESYWDEFFMDLGVHLLPLAVLVVIGAYFGTRYLSEIMVARDMVVSVSLVALGVALLARFRFSYRGDFFPSMDVAALLKKVKVSAVRPVPCQLAGTVIGRGVPGYIFSEDFVMKDDTGIIFLDYRQPLAIWELLFGLLRAGRYNGREVVVKGWYRRSPVPYVEVNTIECDGQVTRSWVPILYQVSTIVLIVLGVLWAITKPITAYTIPAIPA